MAEIFVGRDALEALGQADVLFDALIWEDERSCVFQKMVTMDDPGVRQQRATEKWPHHLPGELAIALTGQAGVIAVRRMGLTAEGWRGHGVRIRDARFPAPVLLGETFFTRVEVLQSRKIRDSVFVRFAFRMWKIGGDGKEIDTYRSEHDAMFFPG